MSDVRERALEVLAGTDLEETDDALLRDGFAYEMLIAHEHQHNETMLQLLQMVPGYEPAPSLEAERLAAPAVEPVAGGGEMVLVEGGSHEVGAPDGGFAYDNERPRHSVELESFEIDRTPVTNGQFSDYVAETGAEAPMYWEPDGEGRWLNTVFGRREPLDPALPVVHVDYPVAAGFARWAGKRLPTEHQWEAAARGADPERANLDGVRLRCAPAGAFADAPSECGAVQMLGEVWEWTRSDFLAYPGFRAFPYPEYSEVFFGSTHKVLRGGSWATRRGVIRTSFRNWDLPERRQIFSGLRCVREL